MVDDLQIPLRFWGFHGVYPFCNNMHLYVTIRYPLRPGIGFLYATYVVPHHLAYTGHIVDTYKRDGSPSKQCNVPLQLRLAVSFHMTPMFYQSKPVGYSSVPDDMASYSFGCNLIGSDRHGTSIKGKRPSCTHDYLSMPSSGMSSIYAVLPELLPLAYSCSLQGHVCACPLLGSRSYD